MGVLVGKTKEKQSLLLDRRGGCFIIFVLAERPYLGLLPNMVKEQPCLELVSILLVWLIFSWQQRGDLAASRAASSPGLGSIYSPPFPEGSHILGSAKAQH